jgi:hypothetical protein
MLGNSVFLDIQKELWRYDANSLVTDNGTTVIKPDELLNTDPGRYIFIYQEPVIKKIETFSGISNSSGNYTVVFSTPYTAIPNIQPQPFNPDLKDFCRVTARSLTGFTVNIQRRTDIAGLLPTYAAVNGAVIDVLVTQTN